MTKSALSMVASVVFMLGSFVAVFIIWNNSSKAESAEQYSTVQSYAPVDISNIKNQADQIISGYQNNAGIPIPVPLAKMGKSNPFTDPE